MELSLPTILIVYFVPTACAVLRGHMSGKAIFVTNLLLGWTGIGWVFALIWSFTSNTKQNFNMMHGKTKTEND